MGHTLIEILVQGSGLPEEYARMRILDILANSKVKPEEVTLNQMRDVIASLLQDTLSELAD